MVNFWTVPPIPATECKLKLPDNTVCSYKYNSGTTATTTTTTSSPDEICHVLSDLSQSSGICDFNVNITSKSLSGIYILEYTMKNSTVGRDTFYVYLLTGKNIQVPKIYFTLSSY